MLCNGNINGGDIICWKTLQGETMCLAMVSLMGRHCWQTLLGETTQHAMATLQGKMSMGQEVAGGDDGLSNGNIMGGRRQWCMIGGEMRYGVKVKIDQGSFWCACKVKESDGIYQTKKTSL